VNERKDAAFFHEKLDVYHIFLAFAGLSETVVADAGTFAVANQLERATESIGTNLIRGNTQWTDALRVTSLDVSIASAHECAACLDVCLVKQLIRDNLVAEGKGQLRRVIDMLHGLRKITADRACEDPAPYGVPAFSHEHLDVYRLGLDFVQWVDVFLKSAACSSRDTRKLDASSTSVVLNIAEGNAKVAGADRIKYIDTAHIAALQCALVFDLMVARGRSARENIRGGKAMLSRICAMLISWRKSLGG
jgi:four helix bundle protein